MFFTTSTINNWIPLLARDVYRDTVIQSIQFLIDDRRIKLHGYVIMPNHIHFISSPIEPYSLSDILRDFHKFTSQHIIKSLRNRHDPELASLQSNRKDRRYQIWRNSHAIKQIESYQFFKQKLEYIHNNPCSEQWQLCNSPKDYPYSSAGDYIMNQPGILKIERVLE